MIVALLFGFLFLLIALGLPIALSIGLPAIGFMLTPGVFPSGVQISALGQTIVQLLFAGVDSFDLLAIPLFMLAGSIMETGGISRQLIDFSDSLVGGVPGGLACAVIVASMFFAGMPSDIAEYIQASSRVGRTHVGFVVLVPTPQRRRDRQIIEVFDIFKNLFERARATPTGEMARLLQSPVGALKLQFRMRGPIGELVSRAFYRGQLATDPTAGGAVAGRRRRSQRAYQIPPWMAEHELGHRRILVGLVGSS